MLLTSCFSYSVDITIKMKLSFEQAIQNFSLKKQYERFKTKINIFFSVTRARLRQVSSIKVGIFMCAYAITYTTLFIFEQKYFDPGEVLYIYESIAGYGLVKIYLQT